MSSVHLNLRFSAAYRHAPDVVWAALTDRRALAAWFLENDFEPQVGKAFSVRSPHIGLVRCIVVALDPPHRMEWSWEPSDVSLTTRVIFTLEPVPGGTQLTIEHVGPASSAHRASISQGWPTRLGRLERWLDERVPTPGRRVETGA